MMFRVQGYIEHELTHAVQNWMSLGLGQPDAWKGKDFVAIPAPGLPGSKLMTPELNQQFEQLTSREAKRYAKQLKKIEEQGLSPYLHELDDVEFYTRLADEAREFRKEHGRKPPEEKKDAFRTWVGQKIRPPVKVGPGGRKRRARSWFLILKSHAPGKYRKAIKELLKVV